MIPLDLVRDVGRRYPDAWKALDGFRATRGRDGLDDWPDWCWCPLAGAYAVATGGSDDRLPSGNAVALIGAVAAWRASQGVYRIHPDILREIRSTPIQDVPIEWLYQLPEWCVWIDLDDGGVFAHLEHDANTGRPELRYWVVPADRHGYPVIVHLDRPTIADGIAAAMAEAQRQAVLAWAAAETVSSEQMEGIAAMAEELTALVVYLIGAVRDGDCQDARRGPAHPLRSIRTPNHPTTWEIGWKQGHAFAQALAAADQGGSHSGPRPHVRRAHWHSFWSGRDEGLKLSIRWLPPIFVGSGEIIPTIHDIGGSP